MRQTAKGDYKNEQSEPCCKTSQHQCWERLQWVEQWVGWMVKGDYKKEQSEPCHKTSQCQCWERLQWVEQWVGQMVKGDYEKEQSEPCHKTSQCQCWHRLQGVDLSRWILFPLTISSWLTQQSSHCFNAHGLLFFPIYCIIKYEDKATSWWEQIESHLEQMGWSLDPTTTGICQWDIEYYETV